MTQPTKRKGTPRPNNGGPRQNTGLVQRLELSKESARLLRIVLLARYGKAGKETTNAWLDGTIRQMWADYDATLRNITARRGMGDWR